MNSVQRLFPKPTPPDETDVEAVEARIGTQLPSEFRDFILATGGGVPTESCFSDGNGTDIYVQNFFEVGTTDSPIDLVSEIGSNPASRGLLLSRFPVATANGGDYLMLHKKKGTVYLWEHESDEITKVCNSWGDLIAGIKADFED